MRITAIACSNHRHIPDLEVEVRRHLVVVGPNESGKTSLLRCLDAALGGGTPQLYATFTADSVRDRAAPLTVTVTLGDFSDHERAMFADEIDVDPQTGAERLRVQVAVTCDGEDVEVRRHFHKPGADLPVRREQLVALGWSFLPANRSPERELGVGRVSALRSLLTSLDLGPDRVELTDLVSDLNARLDGSPPVVALRELLAAHLSELFPRAVQPTELVVRLTASADDDPTTEADLHFRHTDRASTPLHRQSDGLRALTTIVVQRLATSSPVLAVDEPEIHLHPRSQARVGSLLAAPDGQRVIATHSPAVLTSFDPRDAVALLPDRARQLSHAARRDEHRFFARWWTSDALEPLTARTCVLVEGPSDRVLLLAVSRAMGLDLDRAGCAVVVAHGVQTFKPLIRLFGSAGFDVPLAGLVDLAEVPIVAGALQVEPDQAALAAARFQTCRDDLEEECVRALGVERHFELATSSGLWDHREVLQRFDVTTPGDLPALGYIDWCRTGKIETALALASALTEDDALALTSLTRLVEIATET